QLEDLARLGAGGDLHPRLAVERGYLDLRPQRGLREAERDLAHHVGPLADEERMLAHAEHDVEVAGHAGVRAGLALAAPLESQADRRGTAIVFSHPKAASSKLISRS